MDTSPLAARTTVADEVLWRPPANTQVPAAIISSLRAPVWAIWRATSSLSRSGSYSSSNQTDSRYSGMGRSLSSAWSGVGMRSSCSLYERPRLDRQSDHQEIRGGAPDAPDGPP